MDLGKWALANNKLVTFLVAILVMGGLFGYYNIPKLEDPSIVVRQALVVGIYPGTTTEQIEQELASPLENSINQVPDIDFIQTRSFNDVCFITVTLSSTVQPEDIEQKWDILRRKINDTAIPAGSMVQVKDDFGDVYGMFYAVSCKGLTPRQLSDYADIMRRELQNVKGVSRIQTYGDVKESIYISMHQDRMAHLGVLPVEVLTTLNGQNSTTYAGYYLSGNNRIRVSVDDRYRTPEDIKSLILQGHEQDQIRLGDIADVEIAESEPVRNSMQYFGEESREGERAICICISAKEGTDILKVGSAVKDKIEQLKAEKLPVGTQVHQVFNQPDRVKVAIESFILNLLLSVLLVAVVLMFCMGYRSGLIMGVSLVVIVMGTILILYYLGGTLQRVSFSSFILCMGMLVDNAIVVQDGILVDKAAGLPLGESLTRTGKRMAMPLLGATMIVVLSFLPIYLSPDVTGLYVHDMFIVLTVSLLLSWILALTHVPLMAKRWLFKGGEKAAAKGTEGTAASYDNIWYNTLRAALNLQLSHRWMSIVCVVLLVILSGIGALHMKQEFFPDMEYEQIYMEYRLPANRNYTQVRQDLDSIQRMLRRRPEVTDVFASYGGSPTRYNLVRSVNLPSLSYGELIVNFRSSHDVIDNYEEIQTSISRAFPHANIRFKRYNLMFMPFPIQLIVHGSDPEVLDCLADSCQAAIKRTGVMRNVIDESAKPVPAFHVGYNQAAARAANLSRSEVSASLLTATDGLPIGNFYENGHQYELVVKCLGAGGEYLTNIADATVFGILPSAASLMTGGGTGNPLRQISDSTSVAWETPSSFRHNSIRAHLIEGDVMPGYDTETARRIVEKELDKIALPVGYNFEWAGEKMAQEMSMENLFYNYPLAILLMIAILVMLFKSFRVALLLFLCIPVVLVGVVPAVLVTGKSFGFVAIVGVLGLVGMMIKNGIVLVDEIRSQLADGKEMKAALTDASMSRLRPVSMASLTTILGMVPLLDDAMFGSMAATIMGGLIAGTIIVLVLIPVLYSLLFSKTHT